MSVLTPSPALIAEEVRPNSQKDSSGWLAGGFAVAIFSLMSISMAVTSRGFLEQDACSHFLGAVSAYSNPVYLVGIWGRPFPTGLYAIQAHFGGRLGVRLTSLALAILISLITRSIAKGQGWRWPTLALVFLLAQPLVFLHSFSEMTELPFGLLIALGFWAYQRRQWFLFAVVMGFGPLSRPEGFGFLAMAFVALIAHRRWWWTVVLFVPLVAWDYCGWVLYGCQGPWWNWLRANWPWDAESLYARGLLMHFVMLLPVVVSPIIFPAAVVGGWLCLRGKRFSTLRDWIHQAFGPDHLRRCEILIVALPAMVLVGHSLLYYLGKMASNGELRYMMVVTPFWALLSARGWGWIFTNTDWKRPLLWAGFAAMLPVLVNRAYTVIPMGNSADWQEAEQIARWYQTSGIDRQYPYIAISHVGLLYSLDLGPESTQLRDFRKDVLDSRPKGTLVVWDRVGALFNSDAARVVPLENLRRAGWRPLITPWTDGVGGWHSAGEWQFFVSDPVKSPVAENSGKEKR
jgi:hypothetical protein